MDTKARIASILRTPSLDFSHLGLSTFRMSDLDVEPNTDIELPTNLRLGHLAERVVAELIRSSTNYRLLHESIQIKKDKVTVGELDFIVKEKETSSVIHVELAYKFYLYDPSLSADPFFNWIGPNRNDSLHEKVEKLKTKQFPLLYHECAQGALDQVDVEQVSQQLCLLASLFVPLDHSEKFSPDVEAAIVGHYMTAKDFYARDHVDKYYHIPPKKEWGMDPAQNQTWLPFKDVQTSIAESMDQRQAILCWEEHSGKYRSFFVVWW